MKIGIITYYDVINYGAVLLAYAMKHTLENLGYEVVFLQYEDVRKSHVQKKNIIKKIRGLTPGAMKLKRKSLEKTTKFCEFKKKNIVLGEQYTRQQNLDLVIVGSDQIFDCKYDFNKFQFAIDSSCDAVISYAPSFGEFKEVDLESFGKKEILIEALNRFEHHSARDLNTQRLLERITGKKPPRVLDPVLLYGFEDEKNIWNEKLINEPYLLIYTWGGTTTSVEFKEAVIYFSRKHNLKTVSVGDYRPWCDIDYSAASPIEFFELYQHCNMVITNMFHGTIFSIINEKPFYSLVMPHNENKLKDLLYYLNLENQIVDKLDELKQLDIPSINYGELKKYLDNEKEKSSEYLEKALLNK